MTNCGVASNCDGRFLVIRELRLGDLVTYHILDATGIESDGSFYACADEEFMRLRTIPVVFTVCVNGLIVSGWTAWMPREAA